MDTFIMTGEGWEVSTKTGQTQKFPRDHTNFHPCEYSAADAGAFYGDLEGYWLPDLCHDNPDTYLEVTNYIRFLRDEAAGIGYDGFRYDAVKYFDSWIVQSIQEWQKCFGVVEFWDDRTDAIKRYLDYIQWSASAFDFPLFYTLRQMCNDSSFDMRRIWGNGLMFDAPMRSVPFVENHDTDRSTPVIHDKLMAYALALTHEGFPCVFWRDYYNYGLALPGTPNGLEKLCQVHRDYAGGGTALLYTDANTYIAQRAGYYKQKGLVVVLNNHASEWRGAWVSSGWSGMPLQCAAWWGKDMSKPDDKVTALDGRVELWAPPRGFAIYVPAR